MGSRANENLDLVMNGVYDPATATLEGILGFAGGWAYTGIKEHIKDYIRMPSLGAVMKAYPGAATAPTAGVAVAYPAAYGAWGATIQWGGAAALSGASFGMGFGVGTGIDAYAFTIHDCYGLIPTPNGGVMAAPR